MTLDAVREAAEELPEHQTSRGNEFRAIPVEDRYTLAQWLVRSRGQVNASNASWDDKSFRRTLREKKNLYYYHAGRLGLSHRETRAVWWSFVHDDPVPAEKRERDLI